MTELTEFQEREPHENRPWPEVEQEIIDLLETASKQIELVCYSRSSDLTEGDRNALKQLDLVVNSIKLYT